MPQPTPLMLELGRLIRVDRAARLLVESAAKQFDMEKMRYGASGHVYVRVTGLQFVNLWEAVHQVNERCPNIIYPDRGPAELGPEDE